MRRVMSAKAVADWSGNPEREKETVAERAASKVQGGMRGL